VTGGLLAASCAVLRQRRSALSPRSPFHCCTQRAAVQGTTGVDPNLGHQLDRQLAAVALGERLHDREPRLGAGSTSRCCTSSTTSSRPTSTTAQRARVPRPSTSSTTSPARSRFAPAACRPSAPVSRTRPA
jgi:hypothetical protein